MFKLILLIIIGIVPASIIPVSFAIDPLDRAPASSPHLEDFFGNQVSENLNVNQQVQITADILNNQEISQDFVYIVQIKNDENVIVHLSWITGSLNPSQTFSPALSWTPELVGGFVAEIYVWDSLKNQNALSDYVFINITAS